MADDSSEVSVGNCYCVVYKLVNQDWVVTGEGWAQVHLYRDDSDNSHRIVGWTVNDSNVVLNCNVTSLCKYKKKSEDFHKFQDEMGTIFGFGFYKKEESIEEASAFMETVLGVINGEQKQFSLPPKVTPVHSSKSSITSPEPYNHQVESKAVENLYTSTKIPLGKLQILPQKQLRGTTGDSGISDPYSVVHHRHVAYDEGSRKYDGLPPEWEMHLKQQFGLPPNRVECEKMVRYKSRIPKILNLMKDQLFSNGGLEVEGIFRLAPDADECNFVKKQLNENTFSHTNDVNVMANLIKVWFRDLPEHILDHVDPEKVKSVITPDEAHAVVLSMREPWQSIMNWLCDLCVEVSRNHHINKMTAKNLAIVIGPNLFTPSAADPMASLMYSQKVATFFLKAIESRESMYDSLPQ